MSMAADDMAAVLALVPDAAVTATAAHSGNWSDPATWQNSAVPTAGANVLIPAGATVTLDATTNPLHTVRVDGTLEAAPTQDTALFVDTLVVNQQGVLLLGTPLAPIAAGNSAIITFTDTAPINPMTDPTLIGRGLISLGTVTMNGAAVTPYVTLAQSAAAGSTTLTLAQSPTNWHTGDEIILAGTDAKNNEDEDLHILAVAGNQVTLSSPLAYDHISAPQEPVYLTDVTRNVVLQSANPADTSGRGHTLFMTNSTNIQNVEFLALGRTDKSTPINDPAYDSQGNLVPGTGLNPRGRYAIYFYEIGTDATVPPAVVQGSSVVGSPGWGFVNDSSYVTFANDVAFNITGAAFVTESGDEIGTFQGDLAIHSLGGPDVDVNLRSNLQDFGYKGEGFWFQGNGLHIENNIAIGMADVGYVMWSLGFQLPGQSATTFSSANLPNPALAGGAATVPVQSVPIFDFVGNIATTSLVGLELRYQLGHQLPGEQSVINGFLADYDRFGIQLLYSQHVLIENSVLLGDGATSQAGVFVALEGNAYNSFVNLTVQGWVVGVHFSEQGAGQQLTGGIFNNVHNIEIPSALSAGRSITITGVTFAPSTDPQHEDVFWEYEPGALAQADAFGYLAQDTVLYNAMQLYAPWQAASFVPFPQQPASGPPLPTPLLGLTNQQLWSMYGLAMGGAVAPPAVSGGPLSNGTAGSQATYPPPYPLASNQYTNQLTGYRLAYNVGGKHFITDPTPVNLVQGWNAIVRTINGYRYTFFIFGDITPPTFIPSPGMQLVLPISQLANGFMVTGKMADDSNGLQGVDHFFSNLTSLPVYRRPDGSEYLVLEFVIADRAGNQTTVDLDLTLINA
jgi:hypothetical protein